MTTGNGATVTNHQHLFADQLEALKTSIQKLFARVTANPAAEPLTAQRLRDRAAGVIKAHPLAAVAVGIALGYTVVRLARR